MSLNSQACSSSELWLFKYQPINVKGNTEGNSSVWFKKNRQCEVHYALISITYGAPFMPNALFKLRPSFYIRLIHIYSFAPFYFDFFIIRARRGHFHSLTIASASRWIRDNSHCALFSPDTVINHSLSHTSTYSNQDWLFPSCTRIAFHNVMWNWKRMAEARRFFCIPHLSHHLGIYPSQACTGSISLLPMRTQIATEDQICYPGFGLWLSSYKFGIKVKFPTGLCRIC